MRDELFHRPTPLLRWRGALLKLELLRPSGGVDDRALAIFPQVSRGARAFFSGSGSAALAAAAWALARDVQLAVSLEGPVTYEVRETLKLYRATVGEGGLRLPRLDDAEAVLAMERTLAAELPDAPGAIVAPAGARAALLGCVRALRPTRAVALAAADEELPDLPRAADLPGVEIRRVTRAECSRARHELARTAGVLASHAAAMAAVVAAELGGAAIVSASGEREFSLERPS